MWWQWKWLEADDEDAAYDDEDDGGGDDNDDSNDNLKARRKKERKDSLWSIVDSNLSPIDTLENIQMKNMKFKTKYNKSKNWS